MNSIWKYQVNKILLEQVYVKYDEICWVPPTDSEFPAIPREPVTQDDVRVEYYRWLTA